MATLRILFKKQNNNRLHRRPWLSTGYRKCAESPAHRFCRFLGRQLEVAPFETCVATSQLIAYPVAQRFTISAVLLNLATSSYDYGVKWSSIFGKWHPLFIHNYCSRYIDFNSSIILQMKVPFIFPLLHFGQQVDIVRRCLAQFREIRIKISPCFPPSGRSVRCLMYKRCLICIFASCNQRSRPLWLVLAFPLKYWFDTHIRYNSIRSNPWVLITARWLSLNVTATCSYDEYTSPFVINERENIGIEVIDFRERQHNDKCE